MNTPLDLKPTTEPSAGAVTAGGRRSTALFAGSLVALLAACAFFYVHAADRPARNTDAEFRNYVEFLRADLKSGKVALYSRAMNFSADEAVAFWPVYQDYERELFALGDRRLELIKKYAEAWNNRTLNDATAKDLTKGWFAQHDDRIKLWKKYQKRIDKELGAVRAAQFLQLEYRINALLDLMVASEVPLVRTGMDATADKP